MVWCRVMYKSGPMNWWGSVLWFRHTRKCWIYDAKTSSYQSKCNFASIWRNAETLSALLRETIGHNWTPSESPVIYTFDIFWVFFLSKNNPLNKQLKLSVIWNAMALMWRHCNAILFLQLLHQAKQKQLQADVSHQWASCQIIKLRFAHAPGMQGTFSPPPRVSDPDMHHSTCVTHVPWCMSGSLTSGFL